jgi:3-methyladenine DNA glycosylase AlkD
VPGRSGAPDPSPRRARPARRAEGAAAPDAALIAAVREALVAHADPGRAPAMQRYMKSTMPFLGVGAATLTAALRPVFRAHPQPDVASFGATVRALYVDATHREERYAAIALARAAPSRRHRTLELLPLYAELVTVGAWWDLVDPIATHLVGELLLRHPEPVGATLRAWAQGDALWLHRTAILAQLRARERTDLALLEAVLAPALASREFFLRKAVGWALRQYAYTDPDYVRRYVETHAAELSGLSRREALKHLGDDGDAPSPRTTRRRAPARTPRPARAPRR